MAVHHTEEQKIEVANRVCELYESQGATIESCCDACGITGRAFRLWCVQNSEISERYKKAKSTQEEIYWEELKPLAQTAIQRLLKGETKIDKKIETGNTAAGPYDKEATTESEILPHATIAIFAMKGLYPEKFSDKSEVKHSGELKTDFMQLPLEKRLKIIEILESEESGQ